MEPTFERGFLLQEALDMVYNDEHDVRDIYICPPEPNILTDEDSADEDEGGLVDNLSRRQLLAAAEIRYSNNDKLSSEGDNGQNHNNNGEADKVDAEFLEADIEIGASDFVKSLKGKKYTTRTWMDGDFEIFSTFPQPDYSQFKHMPPTNLFELFFDSEMLNHILDETRKYAIFLNCPDPQITLDELKCFIGILIVSGYNILPGKRSYWDSGADVSNEMIKIMRFLHCEDNCKLNTKDKMWKLRPIVSRLQTSFLKYYQPTENMNYDESMVKYYGRHHCKQFIRAKPIRFGYKVWCLNSENSYLFNFDIYQGKNPNSNDAYENAFGKAAAPLVSMLDRLPEKNLPYQIYTDNLFTGFSLLEYLKANGYGRTGSIRENRIPKDFPVTDKKTMSKKSSRSYKLLAILIDSLRFLDNFHTEISRKRADVLRFGLKQFFANFIFMVVSKK